MRKKWIGWLMSAALLFTGISTSTAASEADIAAMEQERSYAESQLAGAQAAIGSLTAQQQEMEAYLAELNAQYESLTAEIESLSEQAGAKEEELKVLNAQLEDAKAQREQQYTAMKARIVYLYENGRGSLLTELLKCGNLADFINRAEKISEISKYDRNMLEKFEALQTSIAEQEQAVEAEVTSINGLLAEKGQHQQEVDALVAQTNDSIAVYAAQIGATQAEAAAWMAEIRAADAGIANLLAEAARAQALAEQEDSYNASWDSQEESYEDYDQSYVENQDSSYEENYYEESYDDSYDSDAGDYGYEESSSSGGSGKYLGNFTLTAYCNCAICCGTAGNLTASGTVPTVGRTVAMGGIPFGTQLLINGNVYTVEDRGTPYGHVDIYFSSHSEALAFGLQSAEVYQLN